MLLHETPDIYLHFRSRLAPLIYTRQLVFACSMRVQEMWGTLVQFDGLTAVDEAKRVHAEKQSTSVSDWEKCISGG